MAVVRNNEKEKGVNINMNIKKHTKERKKERKLTKAIDFLEEQ